MNFRKFSKKINKKAQVQRKSCLIKIKFELHLYFKGGSRNERAREREGGRGGHREVGKKYCDVVALAWAIKSKQKLNYAATKAARSAEAAAVGRPKASIELEREEQEGGRSSGSCNWPTRLVSPRFFASFKCGELNFTFNFVVALFSYFFSWFAFIHSFSFFFWANYSQRNLILLDREGNNNNNVL